MYRSLHDVLLPHEDSVIVHPTHGAGSLCSTGIAVDVVVDDRLRAAPRPAARPARRRCLRPGAARRSADDPALLRPDAPDQPGRPAAARRQRAGHRAARRRRARRGAWPTARSSSTPGRPRPTPPAHSPARCRSRPARRSGHGSAGWSMRIGRSSCSPTTRRPRRPRAPGHADRLRDDRGPRRRRVRGLAPVRPSGRGRAAFDVDAWRRSWRRGGPRRRSSSTSGRHTSSRPVMCRASVHIGGGRAAAMLDRASARPSDRPDLCQRLPLERRPRRCSARPGFERVAAVGGGLPDWEARGYPIDYGAGTDGRDWPASPRHRRSHTH